MLNGGVDGIDARFVMSFRGAGAKSDWMKPHLQLRRVMDAERRASAVYPTLTPKPWGGGERERERRETPALTLKEKKKIK